MPRSSLSYALISDAALGSLSALGARLKEARLLRNWTQADAAVKAGLSESSIRKVESGSPHITVGAYLALLDVFGLPTAFDRVLARGDDTLGEALGRNAMRKRARSPLATEADEFDI
ncbi:MAG: helix-turn-helix transcriptional regulator [Gammaproteobacteria bacterium]|jgi:transcriptional regulator with XRE-family HTH domain|nr:helix-turn-helix domain-containing protein [Gammaproteobacteria bacterium]